MAITNQNLIFTDLETTGIDPETHEIIEIAMLVVRQPGLEVADAWEAKVMPEHLDTADPESLEIAGWKPDAWKNAILQADAVKTFSEKARGGVLAAYNVTFDWSFLDKTARRLGIPLGLDYHRLDVLSMAYLALFGNGTLPGLGLEKVARALGVKLDRTERHSAMEDTRAMFEIFKKLIKKDIPIPTNA